MQFIKGLHAVKILGITYYISKYSFGLVIYMELCPCQLDFVLTVVEERVKWSNSSNKPA